MKTGWIQGNNGKWYYLKLDGSNDLVMVDGDLTLTTTKSEIAAQTLGITLRTFRGEWFLNSNFGVPYLQEIIGVAKKKEIVDRIFLSTMKLMAARTVVLPVLLSPTKKFRPLLRLISWP